MTNIRLRRPVPARVRRQPYLAVALAALVAPAALASGPEPARVPSAPARAASAELSQRDIDAALRVQAELLAQLRREVAALPRGASRPADDAARRQQLERVAEIERRIGGEGVGPRRRYISPGTREEPSATYYQAVRVRIEERGTRDFPTAGGDPLYGDLIMSLRINRLGRLVDATIERSSGQRTLDQRALAIARAAGPYAAFPPLLAKVADEVVITTTFKFAAHGTSASGVLPSLAVPGSGALR